MVILYAGLVLALAAAGLVVRWRVGAAKEDFDAKHDRYESLVNGPKSPSYNDPAYLVRVATVGDAIKDRAAAQRHHEKWASRDRAFGRLREALHNWRGRKAPYALGFLDAVGLLGALDLFGLHGQLGQAVVAFARTLFTSAGG